MANRLMKYFISSILVLLLSGFALGQAAAPKMEIKEKKFNAGEVLEGTVVEHVYKVFNNGADTLEIKKVNPG